MQLKMMIIEDSPVLLCRAVYYLMSSGSASVVNSAFTSFISNNYHAYVSITNLVQCKGSYCNSTDNVSERTER